MNVIVDVSHPLLLSCDGRSRAFPALAGVSSLFCKTTKCQELLEKEFDEAEAFEDEHLNGDNGNGDGGELAAELEIQEAVFMSSYIPRSLHEVCCVVLCRVGLCCVVLCYVILG